MSASGNFWQRKLLAFLHDPPEKAYDFSAGHEERARIHAGTLGLAGVSLDDPSADWMSSAADRLVFPKANQLVERTVSFRHPLSGSEASFRFPDQVAAQEAVSAVLPAFRDLDDHARFWLVWRLWPQYSAEARTAAGCGALPYLPADTRLPDHSIWNHCSMASALESTRSRDGRLRPAFLLFQLGPVQDFIAQARSTRDLWSGSYLVSFLMSRALDAVATRFGPDAVIYPSLRGQPLHDWLNRDALQKAQYPGSNSYWDAVVNDVSWQRRVLTPSLPNRFLALVGANCDPAFVTAAVRDAWKEIGLACVDWLVENGCGLDVKQEARFRTQLERQWQTAWQKWEWPDADETMKLFGQIPASTGSGLPRLYEVAREIERGSYGRDKLSPAWAWHANYHLCAHRFDARRQTRDFSAWPGEDGAAKDDYSGREETVVDDIWIAAAIKKPALGHLFREREHLCAANLIKRVWHKAYLQKQELSRANMPFDSVPAVAAASWRARLPAADQRTWDALMDDEDAGKAFVHERRKVHGSPSNYYAVLALDGDNMGKWLGGELTPLLRDVVSPESACFFSAKEKWADVLSLRRPLSPSWHLQFSEALSNFAVYCAGRIVEQHCGQLIYAGGDDVLAMLPADEAIACAENLRLAFQGDAALQERLPSLFRVPSPGFVQLNEQSRRRAEPSWPLLVPGPSATLSVGVSIGHKNEPLQDMIQTARDAEKRAKTDFGRNALAVTLFKRSGETVEWGAKFGSPAFPLLVFLRKHYRAVAGAPEERPIPGRFPYRVAAMLRPYNTNGGALLAAELVPVVKAEMKWAVTQIPRGRCPGEIKAELLKVMDSYADHLASVQRKTDDGRQEVAPRPLAEFWNLFAVEAFIARQEE